jgi:hypothetical protein
MRTLRAQDPAVKSFVSIGAIGETDRCADALAEVDRGREHGEEQQPG